MASDLEDLKRRLVVGHQPGGRCVYNVTAKAELVELCLQPGASVSRLARECGINASQVSRWVREDSQKRQRAWGTRCAPATSTFVAVPVLAGTVASQTQAGNPASVMSLQARLPNGVKVELHGADLRQFGEVIQTLGRLACSVSTTI